MLISMYFIYHRNDSIRLGKTQFLPLISSKFTQLFERLSLRQRIYLPSFFVSLFHWTSALSYCRVSSCWKMYWEILQNLTFDFSHDGPLLMFLFCFKQKSKTAASEANRHIWKPQKQFKFAIWHYRNNSNELCSCHVQIDFRKLQALRFRNSEIKRLSSPPLICHTLLLIPQPYVSAVNKA